MPYDDRYPLKDYLNTLNYSKDDLMEDDPGWKKNYPCFYKIDLEFNLLDEKCRCCRIPMGRRGKRKNC